jgi:hypothetical protein
LAIILKSPGGPTFMYTPINTQGYVAAYSGAVAGMAVSGWITDSTAADYALVAAIAGAFAEAFDLAWNSAGTLDSLQFQTISAVCGQEFKNRPPAPFAFSKFALPATWAAPAAGCAALVQASEAYVIAQGVTPAIPSTLPPVGPNGEVLTVVTGAWAAAALPVNRFAATKTANQTVTNSAVLVPEGTLLIPIAASDTWVIDATFYLQGAGSGSPSGPGGIVIQVALPTGATMKGGAIFSLSSGTSDSVAFSNALGTNTVAINSIFGAASGPSQDTFNLVFAVTGDGVHAGNVSFNWAQLNANATGTTMLASSLVTAIKH